jgi:hypothetical protein
MQIDFTLSKFGKWHLFLAQFLETGKEVEQIWLQLGASYWH